MSYWIATPEARAAGARRDARPPIVAHELGPLVDLMYAPEYDEAPDAPTSCVRCGADCTDRVCCSSSSYTRVELELGERIPVTVHDAPTCRACCHGEPAPVRTGSHAEGPAQ